MNKFTERKLTTIPAYFMALAVLFVSLNATAEGFRIRPHLQNVSQTGATLIWETDEAETGSIQYGLEDATLEQRVDESEPVTIHRLRIDNLKPDTNYTYRIEADGDIQEATFVTTPDDDREITFVVIGDPRRWDDRWAETGMDEHVKQWNADLFLTMGDLVVDGHQYEQWPEHFARFQDLTDDTWFVTARGNHEGSQIRDTKNDWFAKYHELPGGEPYVSFEWGNTHFVLISYESTGREKDWTKSAKWLDEHLSTVDKKYTVVAQHFPVYCTGYDSTDLSRKEPGERAVEFRNVHDKHNVTLNISGHTHIYERHYPLRNNQRDDRNGTYYVVNGGDINGNYADWWTAVSDDSTQMAKPTYSVFQAKQDRVITRTFAWSKVEERIVQIDYFIIWKDESIPQGVLNSLSSRSGEALIEAIDDLGALLYAPAAEALLLYLDDDNEAVRHAAGHSISLIANAEISQEVFDRLGHSDPRVSAYMARALEVSTPKSLIKKIRKIALDRKTPEATRIHLVGALQFHASASQAAGATIDILNEDDASSALRQRAAYALGQTATRSDIRDITGVVKNESDRYVLMTLGRVLNNLTRNRVSLGRDSDFSRSSPGQRKEFTDTWLKN